MIELKRLSTVLIGIGITLVTLSLIVSKWGCGNIFRDGCTNRSAMLAVLVLTMVGLICAFLVFLVDLLSCCSVGHSEVGNVLMARFVLIYAAAALFIIAMIVYIASYVHQWSFIMAFVGTGLVTQAAILAIMSSRCVTTRVR